MTRASFALEGIDAQVDGMPRGTLAARVARLHARESMIHGLVAQLYNTIDELRSNPPLPPQ